MTGSGTPTPDNCNEVECAQTWKLTSGVKWDLESPLLGEEQTIVALNILTLRPVQPDPRVFGAYVFSDIITSRPDLAL